MVSVELLLCLGRITQVYLSRYKQRQNSYQIFGFRRVLFRKQSVSRSGSVSTTSSTNSVNIIFGVVWVIIVNDKLDVINVKASSSNVCGYQDGRLAMLELVENPVTLLLLFVSVDAHGGVSLAPH